MNEILFYVVIIGIGLLEVFGLANTQYFWLCGIIPLLGTLGIIYILVKSSSLGFRDFLEAAIGIFILLTLWGQGHDMYEKRLKKQKDKMLSQDLNDKK
ncbi:hypothetical protein [Pediococcus argentinicus]|uniref:hypothetical protein n=1 Tax=Pediococcus argentinicus TaxID=480391 RepID=UPI000709A78F|nr:hypothetical protein [Pediococcus argentinicus]NKZ21803.1 hypothetical protein [Pediococcus argentinicus]GEP18937.1 hypothetical protein LSA03_03210 [Pediococcus argentinicus]